MLVVIAGSVLVIVVAVAASFAMRRAARNREAALPPIGPPVTMPPSTAGAAPPVGASAVPGWPDGVGAAGGATPAAAGGVSWEQQGVMSGLDGMLDALQGAMADGNLTPEEQAEIARRAQEGFPGAQVNFQSSQSWSGAPPGVGSAGVGASGAPGGGGHQIQVQTVNGQASYVVDGTPYARIDDIPDPALREAVRQATAGLGGGPPGGPLPGGDAGWSG